MTGKRFTEDQRVLLERMLTLKDKLSNHDIAFILGFDERTIRRRRYEFEANGKIAPPPDVSKNAEKLKAENLEKLVEWLKDNDDALIEDMQKFLKEACDCNVSKATISRQLNKVTKENRQMGRVKRLKARAKRAAEGRNFDFTTARSTSRSATASVDRDSIVGEPQSQEQQQGQQQDQQQPQQEPGHLHQQQIQPRELPPGQQELPQIPHQQGQQKPEAGFEQFQPSILDFPTPEQALLSLSRTQPQGQPSTFAESSRTLAQTQLGTGASV
ncbi:hypothetical protein QBC32DRAFT_138092 [Pseudoneurospora amorphoporcata]|uniref:Uncharacterized protein n=1 Tax=Pseudoneurospora amorphoporcata TaxID=241081 RepID=A0AAN6P497_9PEZI|nr:hypothetical protein QBC32DRAFT_138092 [Pseudoneurospora amorphoporcata]